MGSTGLRSTIDWVAGALRQEAPEHWTHDSRGLSLHGALPAPNGKQRHSSELIRIGEPEQAVRQREDSAR